MNPDHQALGRPHVQLAGLKLWVHGYQYRDASDVDDANWLNATAICSEQGASVLVRGAFVCTTEILAWQHAVEALADNLASAARLACMEPELEVTLVAKPLGAVDVEVRITPDNLTQEHRFTFAIDQSFLAPLASQCAHVLDIFPIRGA